MSKDEILDFFQTINDLKHTERKGWKKAGIERPRDTIASHSFGAAMIGWVLAEETGTDSERAVKMLLIHDLIMAHIPDYTPEEEEFDSKKDVERQKTEELIENIPDAMREELKQLLEELREQETETARLAKEADKLDTLLQAMVYSEETGEDLLEEFKDSYREFFRTEKGKRIFESLGNE